MLSSNDGCVVARSDEAKALGISNGTPWFQLKDDPRYRQVIARSSNYEMYGDISARMMRLLNDHTAYVAPYSIDEAFLLLPAERASAIGRESQQQYPRQHDLGNGRPQHYMSTRSLLCSGSVSP